MTSITTDDLLMFETICELAVEREDIVEPTRESTVEPAIELIKLDPIART